MDAPLNIYVRWDDYGYVASSPEAEGKSRHCSGTKEAAAEFAQEHLPKGVRAYRLVFVRRGHYQAVPVVHFAPRD